MLIEVFLIEILKEFRLFYINGLEALTELSSRCRVRLLDLPGEAVLQLLHDDLPKCISISFSCLCIVVCVLLSVSYVVIQGVI
jgi:hypothetical protein